MHIVSQNMLTFIGCVILEAHSEKCSGCYKNVSRIIEHRMLDLKTSEVCLHILGPDVYASIVEMLCYVYKVTTFLVSFLRVQPFICPHPCHYRADFLYLNNLLSFCPVFLT